MENLARYTEPWIDYSDSQDVPFDNGLYHITLIEYNRYEFEAKKCIGSLFSFK
jgi:hypothetical protein